jgi:hypothetical protein
MRIRLIFSKTGSLRYTGHLDLHTIWERTIRRAGLPLMYTQGFHPGPKIQLASALPLGFIGRCEIVDIWLDETPPNGEDFNHHYTTSLQAWNTRSPCSTRCLERIPWLCRGRSRHSWQLPPCRPNVAGRPMTCGLSSKAWNSVPLIIPVRAG